uniref:DNA-directed RNA polymerase RpoA/D/Rpb3-type domain-containing protein n=1 Tax=viral metagenome TaxID=1070528 RepID=A0A6C0K7V9_9ZZZZ
MPTFQNYNYDEPSGCSSFEINNIDLAIINGIRRVILTDIPIAGIIGEKLENDDPSVDIVINNGALHNEIIIHRIGLIPICLKEEEIDNYKDNSIHIELNVKNTTNKTLDVLTSDITATRNSVNIDKKELADIFPANKISGNHILITRLRTGEHLHFKAKVVKRTGRDNASFNPVSLSNFSYIQDPKEADKKTNLLDKERSYYKNKYGDAVRFKFDIESINHNIGPKYLVSKSLDIIINKLEVLRRELNNTDASAASAASAATKVKIQQFQDIAGTYEFIIEDEDDTLGNIIQSHIHNHFIRENNKYKDKISCTYIGYICPHPLKSLMILRISLEGVGGVGGASGASDAKIFSAFLDDNCAIIAEELSKIKNDWMKFAIDNI